MFFRATNKKQRAYTYLSSVDVSIYCVQAVAVRSQRGVLWFCVSLCCFCFVLICRAQVVQFRFLFCFSENQKIKKLMGKNIKCPTTSFVFISNGCCTHMYVYICTIHLYSNPNQSTSSSFTFQTCRYICLDIPARDTYLGHFFYAISWDFLI